MSEPSQNDATDSPPAAAPAPERPPFQLRRGSRIEFGPRRGKVTVVRGNGPVPYEVQIRWDGVKAPDWFQYGTLAMYYDRDQLKVT